MNQPHSIFRYFAVFLFVSITIQFANGQHSVPEDWKPYVEQNQRLFSKDVFSTSRNQHRSSPLLVPSIGNGYLATVVGSTTVYIGGLFNGKNHNGIELTPASHRARIPAYLNLNVTKGEVDYTETISEGHEIIHPGGFAIDTKQGIYYERFFVGEKNAKAQVEQHRYCHRFFSSLIVHEIHVDNTVSQQPEDIEIRLSINSGKISEDIDFVHLEENQEYNVLQGAIKTPELNNSLKIEVGVVFSSIPSMLKVQANQKQTFSFFYTARTNIPGDLHDRSSQEPWEAALIDFKEASKLQKSKIEPGSPETFLMREHINEWNSELWSQGNIKITGNDELAQVVQSSLYWILLSTRADWPWSLSPGSLASNAYNGHSFWDCETWMYPPLLSFYPNIAKSLLQYRFNHLEASIAKAQGYNHCGKGGVLLFDCFIWPPDEEFWKSLPLQQKNSFASVVQRVRTEIINPDDIIDIPFQNAFTLLNESKNENIRGNCGYQGALFAWESGFTGAEVCPCMAGGTCLHEHHISGDISFAVYQYWKSTHDLKWLRKIGFPLAYEIAKFWASRVQSYGSEYVILNVIPPDESAMGVNNSVFTNVIAKYSLHIATEFGEILNHSTPSNWVKIAKGLKIPFDYSRQIHLEYDEFKEGEHIKQADVVLLGYPLMYPMSHVVRENDLNFYSAITSPRGPAMTWSVTSIGYREVLATREMENFCKQRELSSEEKGELQHKNSLYFFHSYQNAQPPYYIWTETPYGGAYNFITGAGGFLQGLVAGYGGIRLKPDGLHITYPAVPEHTTSFELQMMNFLDYEFDMLVEREQFTLTLRISSGQPLIIEEIDFCAQADEDDGKPVSATHTLSVGESRAFKSMVHLRLSSQEKQNFTKFANWFGKSYQHSHTVVNIVSALIIGVASLYFFRALIQ